MIELAILMLGWPSTMPRGSNVWNVNDSTNSSSGTPYWRPLETAMAKHPRMPRRVAPSLARSMNNSPSVPSPYSPVRRKILWPPTLASWVHPARRLGRRNRGRVTPGYASVGLIPGAKEPVATRASTSIARTRSADSSSWVSPAVVVDDNGWLAFDPSRYNALALRPRTGHTPVGTP